MQLSPIPLTISENQEIVKALQNDEEEFRFLKRSTVPLLSLKPTEDDAEVESFFQKETTQVSLKCCEQYDMNMILHSTDTFWTQQLTVLLALGCQEMFTSKLKSEIIPNDFCFFGLDHGLEVNGKSPSLVLTLGQKQKGGLHIPLLLLEERPGLDDLQRDIPQFSKYAKKIFAQEITIGEKVLGFKSVYVLVMSQKARQVKLIQYQRPDQDQALAQCVKSTAEFGLLENGTYKLNLNYVHDLFRVLFNCISLQLKSLDLIK